MSDSWWHDVYEPDGGLISGRPGPMEKGRAEERKDHDGGESDIATATVPPTAVATKPSGGFPAPAHNWGSGREPDPFLQAPAGTPSYSQGVPAAPPADPLAVAERQELDRHKAPDRADFDPSAPWADKGEGLGAIGPEEGSSTESTETAGSANSEAPKGDTGKPDGKKTLKQKVADLKVKTGNLKAKTGEVTAPTRARITAVREAVSPTRGKKFSMVWSIGASWAVGLPTLVAAYDRALLIGGDKTSFFPRGEYLQDRGQPMSWHLMQGPAPWVRDHVGMAWETGQMDRVAIAAVLGVMPLVLMEVGNKLDALFTEKFGEKGLGFGRGSTWVAGGGAALYVGFFWHPIWWEVYMAALCSAAWWGFRLGRRIKPGFLQFILFIPMAAVLTGAPAYSPGAAF